MSNPYAKAMNVARESRELSSKFSGSILDSEAIYCVLHDKEPDDKEYRLQRDSYISSQIREACCYIDDVQVEKAVRSSFYETRKSGNLIFNYKQVTDKHRQARVRVVTRMLVKKLLHRIGADNMVEIIETVSENTDAKKRKNKKKKIAVATTVESVVETKEVENTENKTETVVQIPVQEIPTETRNEEVSEETLIKNATKSIVTGMKVTTKHIRIYGTSVSPMPKKTYNGDFYIWDETVESGRVRITDDISGIGKISKILGWVSEQEVLEMI